MEGIWDIFKKTAFWKFSNESTVQVNLVVHVVYYYPIREGIVWQLYMYGFALLQKYVNMAMTLKKAIKNVLTLV